MNTETFILPETFASYLMSSDNTGLEQDEINMIEAFLVEKNLGECIYVSENSGFRWNHDFPNIGGATCAEFVFSIK